MIEPIRESGGSFGFTMARLQKTLDQDRAYDEDFSFDFGFALELMESVNERLEYSAAETRRRGAELGVDDFVRRVRDLKALRASDGGVMNTELKAREAAVRREAVAIAAGFAAIHGWQAEVEHLNERCSLHAEMALVEMVDVVRNRIEVLSARPGDSGAHELGEAAAALVLMERLLTEWRARYALEGSAVEAALRFATESIDNYDLAAAEACAREGIPFIRLREMVNLDGEGGPTAPRAA